MQLTSTPPIGRTPLLRQRINKSGNYSLGSSYSQVTGWSSDSTHPATITGDALQVEGGGTATVTATLRRGTFNSVTDWQLRLNGTTIDSTSLSASTRDGTLTWTGFLNPGDQLALWARRGALSGPIVEPGTSIE